MAPMSHRDRGHRLNLVLLATAKLHVRKPKAGRYSKRWSTSELKKRNALRRKIADNRVEYLEACAATRNLSEEVNQKKWEEFLADLENNSDPAGTLPGTPSSTTFEEPLLH